MRALRGKNSIEAGLLLRSLPVLLVTAFIGVATILFGYYIDTNSSIKETTKLRAEAVSNAIDFELERALVTLDSHLRLWKRTHPKSEDVKEFLNELTASNSAFVFHAVTTGRGIDRVGSDVEYQDRYIADLEFFNLPKYDILTTGFIGLPTKFLEIWVEYRLVDSPENPKIVRSLLRISNYNKIIEKILENEPMTLIVIKPETARGSRLTISDPENEAHKNKVPGLNPTRKFETMNLLGDQHVVYSMTMANLPAELIYAPFRMDTLGFRPITTVILLLMLAIGLMGTITLGLRFGRSQKQFVDSLIEVVDQIGRGEEQPIMPASKVNEYQTLSDTIGNLTKTQVQNKARTKVISKGMFELFACNDASTAVMKCVELICTQCHAGTSWFEPFVADQEFYRHRKKTDQQIAGWQWKNHRIIEIDRSEISLLQTQHPDRYTVIYAIKSGLESIGTLKAFYNDGVVDLNRLMLDSLVSILEKTLIRHEAIKKGVLLTTELDIAKAIQKSVVSSGSSIENDERVAQFYKPADRLGGDWFYIIPNRNHDSCYVIMGSVTGGGISQGLLTSGVKGGLDVLDYLIKNSDMDPFSSPAEIIPALQRIVHSMNKLTDSSITCFVAHLDFVTRRLRVANQGHSLPVIVRPAGDRPVVVHNIESGAEIHIKNGIRTIETVLNPGDYFVAFSDGLTQAKSFKSEIFERFMTRALETSKGYETAADLRDDLKSMYNYYTSSKKQNDDVCFMVIKITQEDKALKSA